MDRHGGEVGVTSLTHTFLISSITTMFAYLIVSKDGKSNITDLGSSIAVIQKTIEQNKSSDAFLLSFTKAPRSTEIHAAIAYLIQNRKRFCMSVVNADTLDRSILDSNGQPLFDDSVIRLLRPGMLILYSETDTTKWHEHVENSGIMPQVILSYIPSIKIPKRGALQRWMKGFTKKNNISFTHALCQPVRSLLARRTASEALRDTHLIWEVMLRDRDLDMRVKFCCQWNVDALKATGYHSGQMPRSAVRI